MDSRKVGELLIRRVREYVQPVLDQLADRIAETKAAVLAEMDRRFSEVKSVTSEDMAPIIDLVVANAVANLPAPKDGKSVTVDEVAPLIEQAVTERVSAIPIPKDGTSITLDEVRPLITEAISQISKPKDGTSVTVDELRPTVEEAVLKAVAAIPPPKDGVSVTLDDVRPLIDEAVSRIPKPKDGDHGKSVTIAEVLPELTSTVTAAARETASQVASEIAKAIPVPKDGLSVTVDDVLPTIRKWFDDLPKPKDGDDGKSITVQDVADFMESAVAKWALEFERRANDLIQRCIDRIEKPKDGEDGKDGLGFDDMEIVHDGERSFTFAIRRGDKKKDFTFKIPALIERGVYRDGTSYEQGDGVTAGGNYWIALKDTSMRPGDSNSDWRLAVRKGRDGKDGQLKAVR